MITDPQMLIRFVQDEIYLVLATLREKGAKRFQRPLLIAAAVVGGCYYLALRPQREMRVLRGRLQTAQVIAQNAESFKQARLQLQQIYAVLPKAVNKDRFLTDAVVETLRAASLTSDSIQPPERSADSSLIYQKITVSIEAKFPEMMAWLARLEAYKPFLRVSSLDVTKSRRLGYCTVSVVVSTIVPEKDLAH